MKILQINNFHYIRGGSDRVYFDTIELLSKEGLDVISFSSLNPKNFESKDSNFFVSDVEFDKAKGFKKKIEATSNFLYNKESVTKLQELINDKQPDVAHLHIFQSRLSSAIVKVLKDNNVPIVMTVHEYKMLCPVYTFLDNEGNICEKCASSKNYFNALFHKCNNGNFAKSALSALESFNRDLFFSYVQNIDHFIMVSDFIKKKHIQYERNFEKKSSLLYNFTDLEKFKPNHNKGDYFLYCGRLSHEKGIKTLIDAFSELSEIPLKIVGDGPLRKELEDIVSDLKLNNIEFLGFKSGEELEDLIRNCSFTIVPSEWYENNPMSVIESFAYGKPVIGSRIGGIPELVEDEITGYVFESKNISQLISVIGKAHFLDSIRYEILSKNVRVFAQENFDSKKYLNKLIGIYNKVIVSE